MFSGEQRHPLLDGSDQLDGAVTEDEGGLKLLATIGRERDGVHHRTVALALKLEGRRRKGRERGGGAGCARAGAGAEDWRRREASSWLSSSSDCDPALPPFPLTPSLTPFP
jgi:hypothetical protein